MPGNAPRYVLRHGGEWGAASAGRRVFAWEEGGSGAGAVPGNAPHYVLRHGGERGSTAWHWTTGRRIREGNQALSPGPLASAGANTSFFSALIALCSLESLLVFQILLASSDARQNAARLDPWLELVQSLLARGPKPCVTLLQSLAECEPCLLYYLSGRWSDSSVEFVRRVMFDAFR